MLLERYDSDLTMKGPFETLFFVGELRGGPLGCYNDEQDNEQSLPLDYTLEQHSDANAMVPVQNNLAVRAQ